MLSMLALALVVTRAVNDHAANRGFDATTVTLGDALPSDRTSSTDLMVAGDRPMPATASDGPLLLVGGLTALGVALAFHRATRYFIHG
jgi:hypothetical protein